VIQIPLTLGTNPFEPNPDLILAVADVEEGKITIVIETSRLVSASSHFDHPHFTAEPLNRTEQIKGLALNIAYLGDQIKPAEPEPEPDVTPIDPT
jgi:hypothetical protein